MVPVVPPIVPCGVLGRERPEMPRRGPTAVGGPPPPWPRACWVERTNQHATNWGQDQIPGQTSGGDRRRRGSCLRRGLQLFDPRVRNPRLGGRVEGRELGWGQTRFRWGQNKVRAAVFKPRWFSWKTLARPPVCGNARPEGLITPCLDFKPRFARAELPLNPGTECRNY